MNADEFLAEVGRRYGESVQEYEAMGIFKKLFLFFKLETPSYHKTFEKVYQEWAARGRGV